MCRKLLSYNAFKRSYDQPHSPDLLMKNWIIARRPGLLVFGSVYALVLAACGDSSAPLVPSAIQVVAGDNQAVTAGAKLTVAPSVKVVSTNGKPVPGVAVSFTAASGNGSVIGGSQVTDASGVATVTSWTIGTKAGTSTLTVAAPNLPSISITANTSAGPAAAISVQSGNVQTGTVGAALAVAPSVRVTDSYDNGIAGVSITFAVPAGGSVQNAQAATDANGVASAGTWTLSTKAGNQTLIATGNAPAISSTVVPFLATAVAEPASKIAVAIQPSSTNASGSKLSVQPVVEFRDRYDNVATGATMTVTAALAAGTGTLSGATTVAAANGRSTFTDLTYTGTGSVQLKFTAGSISEVISNSFTILAVSQCAGTALTLNFTLGQVQRFVGTSSNLPQCLEFGAVRNAGEQYLVMFENLTSRGSSTSSLFPGAQSDDGSFQVTMKSGPLTSSQMSSRVVSLDPAAPVEAIDGWNIGGVRAYEIEPDEPAGGAPRAMVKRNGRLIDANSAASSIAAGDTLLIYLQGIDRLSISSGLRKAIVKLVTPDIVIAEDLRFFTDTTFKREGGTRNQPIAKADMEQIAAEYSAFAKLQADRIFSGRQNSATEADPGRPIAVHTMMYSNNIWGYTYSSGNYFAWDYWVNSDGESKQIYQHAQRNADDLFMHEIAHMRHYGMLERAARTGIRGNTWLVEGFARFTERLPIAARLLNNADPSRTGNVVLPLNPAFGGSFFRDDVPTYLSAGSVMYTGYQASAYVFDYFADQVAKAGGNWPTAVQELVIAAGVEADLNAVVSRYIPGVDFAMLFTRARLALYLDDIGTPGLPGWTQYHQYQLRASRVPGSLSASDPRNLWPKLVPGVTYNDTRVIDGGAAFGYLIDGAGATADARFTLTHGKVSNGIVSVVRIK